MAETNTILYSNNLPIKNKQFFKKGFLIPITDNIKKVVILKKLEGLPFRECSGKQWPWGRLTGWDPGSATYQLCRQKLLNLSVPQFHRL